MNGKGDKRRPYVISTSELELRDRLWRAPESEKPAIIAQLNELVEGRIKNGLYQGASDK